MSKFSEAKEICLSNKWTIVMSAFLIVTAIVLRMFYSEKEAPVIGIITLFAILAILYRVTQIATGYKRVIPFIKDQEAAKKIEG